MNASVDGAQRVVGFPGGCIDLAVDRGEIPAATRDGVFAAGPGDESKGGDDDECCRFHVRSLWPVGLCMIGRGNHARGCNKKEAPLLGGAHWSLACLFAEECFRSSCSYPSAVFVEPLENKKSNRCAREIPHPIRGRIGRPEPRRAQSSTLGNMSRRPGIPCCQNLRRTGHGSPRHNSCASDNNVFENNRLPSSQRV